MGTGASRSTPAPRWAAASVTLLALSGFNPVADLHAQTATTAVPPATESNLGRLCNGLAKFGNKAIPAAYTGYCVYEVVRIEQRFHQGQLTPDQRAAAECRRGSGYCFSMAGSWAGGLGGAAAGAWFGPTGVVVGAAAGALVGGIGGEKLGFRLAGPVQRLVCHGRNALHYLTMLSAAGLRCAGSFLNDRLHLKTTRAILGRVKEKIHQIPPPPCGRRFHFFGR